MGGWHDSNDVMSVSEIGLDNVDSSIVTVSSRNEQSMYWDNHFHLITLRRLITLNLYFDCIDI